MLLGSRARCSLAVVVGLWCLPSAALAVDAGPFATAAERIVAEARQARGEADFARAGALLEEVLGRGQAPGTEINAAATHELGLLLRDQGRLVEAAQTLREAAGLNPLSSARVDQAAVLVELGRWPEAVVELRRAFEQQGTALPVQQVTSDPRFARLASLQPYQHLISEVQAEQTGPFGSLLLRLERLSASTRSAERALERLGQWVELARRLSSGLSTAVILLLVLGMLATFAVAQTRFVGPPWTLLAGMLAAAGFWHVTASVGTAGASSGLSTIVTGLTVVFGLWLSGALARLLVRRRQARRVARHGPFAPESLQRTLELVDQVSRLGHRLFSARVRERRDATAELERAAMALRERLSLLGVGAGAGPPEASAGAERPDPDGGSRPAS